MRGPGSRQRPPSDEEELEALLSEPSPEVVEALRPLAGDLVVVGAGGKIGPTLCRMAATALRRAGSNSTVLAISRWTDERSRRRLDAAGVRTLAADLSDPDVYTGLPDAAAVMFLAGQKFGTTGHEGSTWWSNAGIPVLTATRYRGVPTVAYSTGNVYPLRPLALGGATESDAPAPLGEYAQSCLARERVFNHAGERWNTPTCVFRLNYAAELRYGVIVDIGRKILRGDSIDVAMPAVNIVWQRDSNAWSLRCLQLCTTPARIVNATGPETLSVRRIATILGSLLEREVAFEGEEAGDALLSDASECHALFGYPSVPALQLIRWVAHWLSHDGVQLEKATKFQQRDGRF